MKSWDGSRKEVESIYYYSLLVGVVGGVLLKEQQDVEKVPRDDHKCLKYSKDGG